MKQSLGLRIEKQITFMMNGRTYNYQGDVELVPESAVNGLMGQRVLAHKRHARGGPAFTGRLRGVMTIPVGKGYRSPVYLVECEVRRRIYQAVHIKSID